MIKGLLELWQLDSKTGKVKKYIKKHNTVLTSGKNYFWQNQASINYIGIGTDSTAEDASQTGLGNEVRREGGTHSVSNNVFTIEHTFIDWDTSTDIAEAGAAMGSTYFNRVTFSAVTCDADNNIKIKFTITVSD